MHDIHPTQAKTIVENSGVESALPYELAGFGVRLIAFFLDSGILYVMSQALASLLADLIISRANIKTFQDLNRAQGILIVVSLIAGFALVIFYHVIFLTRGGQTPGKRIVGIKVIHGDGSLLNTTEAITRTVGYYVNSLVFWIGYLWILFDVKKQGWHDKMARSLVVKAGKKKR